MNKLFRFGMILCVATLMVKCTFTTGPEEITQTEGLESMIVPDGFNYETRYNVDFNLDFSGNSRLYFEVLNGLADSTSNLLFNGVLEKPMSMSLKLPLHVTALTVKATYKNKLRLFEVEKSTGFELSIDPEDFNHEGDTTSASDGRVARTMAKGCLPEYVGVYFPQDIWWSDLYIIAYSSKDLSNVVLHYENGSEEKIENPTHNFGKSWYITPDAGKILKGVWVKSGCNNSDDGPDYGWYVSNPYYEGNPDADNDGVDDANDIAPEDAAIAKVTYDPAQNEFNTLAFEDLWPYKGDYDFNDFVASHNKTIYTDGADQVSKIIYSFKIRAVGAALNNDFCLSFSDANDIADVSLTSQNDIPFEIIDLGDETEVRFTSIKKVFGKEGLINTYADRSKSEVVQFQLTVKLDRSTQLADLKTDEYLRINQEEGREVHLPGHGFTSLADDALFQTGKDDTDANANKFYLSKENLPWVLDLPIEWAYPREAVDISKAYPNFKEYAQINSELVWYTTTPENIVEEFLFEK